MHTVLLAKEESHVIFFRLFSSSIHTLDSIKHHIAHTFCNFFSEISNTDSMDRRQDELLPCYVRDIIATVGNQYQQRAKKWFSEKKDSCDKEDPELAFNILNAMLKGSLERLKAMRESISWTHIWVTAALWEQITLNKWLLLGLCVWKVSWQWPCGFGTKWFKI